MAESFSFLDRIDQMLDGPADLVTSARETLRSANVAAPSREDVRAVLLASANARLKEPLAQALYDHFVEVKAEFEALEGPCPVPLGNGGAEWFAGARAHVLQSLEHSDVADILGGPQAISDALGDACSAARLAEAVLAVPVDDPAPVLARLGVTDAAVDALVAEFQPKLTALLPPVLIDDIFALSFAPLIKAVQLYLATGGDEAIAAEAVGYLLCEDDVLLRDTGCELLELAGDASVTIVDLVDARDRSDPARCAADAAEVMRLAAEKGGDASAPDYSSRNETAAGATEGDAPAAQAPRVRVEPPVAAEESDLTRAVGAALAVLYDHGCETDKAMAEKLGTTKATVNQARHGKTPWAPTPDQILALKVLLNDHRAPLALAQNALDALTSEGGSEA